MQENLIKEIVISIIDKIGEKIVDILYKKKNVNEFLISKKLNLTINQTRNLLYKLLDKGLVSFIRKKDRKKGGWYTYFWTLNTRRSLELLKDQQFQKMRLLEEELKKRKIDRFYYCPATDSEYSEQEALENNFISPETGEVLQLKDNKQYIDQLDIDISKSRILIEELDSELSRLTEKNEKEKERRMKLEKTKKKKERLKKKAKNMPKKKPKKTKKTKKK